MSSIAQSSFSLPDRQNEVWKDVKDNSGVLRTWLLPKCPQAQTSLNPTAYSHTLWPSVTHRSSELSPHTPHLHTDGLPMKTKGAQHDCSFDVLRQYFLSSCLYLVQKGLFQQSIQFFLFPQSLTQVCQRMVYAQFILYILIYFFFIMSIKHLYVF